MGKGNFNRIAHPGIIICFGNSLILHYAVYYNIVYI